MKHPLWQKKRLEVMELHGFECQNCGAKEDTLNVHHPVYRRGAMIWEYTKEELECLCQTCHKDAHALDEKLKKALAVCTDKAKALAFILSIDSIPTFTRKPLKRADRYAVTPIWMKPYGSLNEIPEAFRNLTRSEFFAKIEADGGVKW